MSDQKIEHLKTNYFNIDQFFCWYFAFSINDAQVLIVLFSLAGIPPLAGFFAKFYIFMSVIESGMYALAIIGLVTTVVSAFYYIRIVKVMYFDSPKKPFENFKNYGVYGSLIFSCIFLSSFFMYPSIFNGIISKINIF